jgi:hypothetical protein
MKEIDKEFKRRTEKVDVEELDSILDLEAEDPYDLITPINDRFYDENGNCRRIPHFFNQ